ncbi:MULTISPECIES: plasmid partitioning protein RepA [unclassified Ensifer]|uniref:plasmid partitioning protein RepA n=1 Tax=unclassified Ensifer TaxID=2633371 RepID=UPI00070DE2CD|nr:MULTISPECIES: plasmid partitioning protein RepA [unclassified Ensifer]KQU95983.1 plasmid partitioning protein RepA [Ensifer sp. Root31]KQW34976.1 plasmid partitioning protein RepA [Ensifer sp. Root1252]KRC57300.1 plasmid partitioning protein RepA [Ensifer sp. Root231]KRC87796.1 plasmid partitioning protein RepA [Ensifer sp. Root258]
MLNKPLKAAGGLRSLIASDAEELSRQLQAHQQRTFPPTARKTIRSFTPAEAADFIGIHQGYLRQIVSEGHGPEPLPNGRRLYSVEDIQELRRLLDEGGKGPRRYIRHRQDGEKLQVISVMNFKGGSGKTTSSAHLAQFLALRGYRVLAIDLDPQASLSALFGHQPELDVGENETLYGAIRYDEERRDITEIVRATYTPNLHIIPGNLELMEFEHETPKALIARGRSDSMFFARIGECLAEIESAYDIVVIDCPPQLGFLTLSALCAATSVLITVHPQMLDVMSMSQFLHMTGDLLEVVENAGGTMDYDWLRYLVTRYEPNDGPQSQMAGFMRSIFGNRVLENAMVKSTAVSDAGLTKQTLYEVDRNQFTRGTYDRALESLTAVNAEIEELVKQTWGRK